MTPTFTPTQTLELKAAVELCSQGQAIPISILNKYSLSFYFVATEKHAKMYISELLVTTVPPYHYQVKLCQTNIIPIWARKIMLKVLRNSVYHVVCLRGAYGTGGTEPILTSLCYQKIYNATLSLVLVMQTPLSPVVPGGRE